MTLQLAARPWSGHRTLCTHACPPSATQQSCPRTCRICVRRL